jgi:heme-degrading monooxygenase HmoA
MIGRIWHGYTTPLNTDAYEALLREEIFTSIRDRNIDGFKSIQLFRRTLGEEVEFITLMIFESLDGVRKFTGEDYEVAIVPSKARALLARFDERSQHYEITAEVIA